MVINHPCRHDLKDYARVKSGSLVVNRIRSKIISKIHLKFSSRVLGISFHAIFTQSISNIQDQI